MAAPSVVIIARSEDARLLRKRLTTDAPVNVFADSEALQAFETILERPPHILALDPAFVATARGAALVTRIKADPHLADVQLRVLALDEAHLPVILAQPVVGSALAVLKASLPLDRYGTRGTQRVPIKGGVATSVNGQRSELIDLSIAGAQLVVPMRLRPGQAVRIAIGEGSTETRCRGVVTWSIAELTAATVQYRAGVKLIDPDIEMIDALCGRYGTPPNHSGTTNRA